MMLSKVIVSPPFSLFWYRNIPVHSDSSPGFITSPGEREQQLIIEYFRAAMFLLKLVDKNSLLDTFFFLLLKCYDKNNGKL